MRVTSRSAVRAAAGVVVAGLLASCGGGDDLCDVAEQVDPSSLAAFSPGTDWATAARDVDDLRAVAPDEVADALARIGTFLADTQASFADAGVDVGSLEELQETLADVPEAQQRTTADAMRALFAAAADRDLEQAYVDVAAVLSDRCGVDVRPDA